jgi:hypothetical protein
LIDGRLWANGGGLYTLANIDYNFWTQNGSTSNNGSDPGTAAMPVKDTESLTKFSQIFAATGYRGTTGSTLNQGITGNFWSKTPTNSTLGYQIYFTSYGMYPADPPSYSYGLSIRCVRI